MAALLLPVGAIQASLEWEQKDLHVTAKLEDTATTATFRFTNRGPSSVSILETKTSCSCSVAQTAKKVYAAGESGEISLSFTHGTRTGEQMKTVNVRTDDNQSNALLSLKVTIPALYTLDKSLLFWQSRDALEAKSVDLIFHDKLPVNVKAVTAADPGFEVRYETLKPGEHYRVSIRPEQPKDANTRFLKTKILVETDLAVAGRSTLSISAIALLGAKPASQHLTAVEPPPAVISEIPMPRSTRIKTTAPKPSQGGEHPGQPRMP